MVDEPKTPPAVRVYGTDDGDATMDSGEDAPKEDSRPPATGGESRDGPETPQGPSSGNGGAPQQTPAEAAPAAPEAPAEPIMTPRLYATSCCHCYEFLGNSDQVIDCTGTGCTHKMCSILCVDSSWTRGALCGHCRRLAPPRPRGVWAAFSATVQAAAEEAALFDDAADAPIGSPHQPCRGESVVGSAERCWSQPTSAPRRRTDVGDANGIGV